MIWQAVKHHTGIAGAMFLIAGLFLSPVLVTIGVILIFLQVILVPPIGKPTLILRENIAFLSVFLLIVLHLAAVLYTSDTDTWLHNLRIKLPLLLLPAGLLSPAFQNLRAFYVIHFWLMGLACIIAVLSGLNYLANFDVINQMILESKPIPIIGGTNHIYYSIFLAYAIVAGMYMIYAFRKEKTWYWIAIVLTTVNFLLIHIIAARTGLLALYLSLLSVMVYFMIWRHKRYVTGIAILVLLPLTIAFFVNRVDSLNNRYQNTLKDLHVIMHDEDPNHRSIAQRLIAYQTALDVYQRHPVLGTGMGDLSNEIQKQYVANNTKLEPGNRMNPHNQYLSFLTGLGLPGLGLFLCLLFYPLTQEKYRSRFLFFAFVVIMASSFLVESILERQMGISFFSFFHFYLLVMIEKLPDKKDD